MGNTSSSSSGANQDQPVDDMMRADTTSVCTTEAATGTHNFVVTNYSLLDGIGVGKSVASSMFSVGGYYWCILFYPDGAVKEHAGYAAAYLCLLSGVAPETGVRVKYALSLHEEGGKVHGHSRTVTSTKTFKSAGNGCGNTIIHKSNLLGGYFTIRCDVTVVQNTNVEMTMLPN